MRRPLRTLVAALVAGLAGATALPASAQKAYPEGRDVTGLRSRGEFTPRQPAGNPDVMAAEYGNGYFNCGGATGPWHGGLGMTVLRKGAKAGCESGPLVLAVTTHRNNGRTVRIETAVPANVPRNHTLVMFACGNAADAAIAKVEDKPQLTRIVAAWKYVGGVLTPVGNLRKVRCANEGHGV
jgi:hypothetical protein